MQAEHRRKRGSRQVEPRLTRMDQAGLSARSAAATMTGLVTGAKASIEDLFDQDRGYAPYLELAERDRALVRAVVLATLRHRMQIQAMLSRCWNRPPPGKAELLHSVLETAAAQIAFMNVPASAAANIAVSLLDQDPRSRRFAGFANAVLRKFSAQTSDLLSATRDVPAFPQWLQRLLQRDHGREKTLSMGNAFRTGAAIDLNGKDGYREQLEGGWPLPGNGWRLPAGASIPSIAGYELGSWWVQDLAAQQPVRLLDMLLDGGVTGRRVADLCAAPGGKTMQLAALGARVTSVDISPRRIGRLRENLARTGLEAEIVCADILEWQGSHQFDGIVLDAPCSATGTMRRHPDIIWNLQPEKIAILAKLQCRLIAAALDLLAPGGILVYANCSLLKQEGEDLVAGLELPNAERITLEPRLLPGMEFCINGRGQFRSLLHYNPAGQHHDDIDPGNNGKCPNGMDGFFAACFRKS